MFVGAVDIKMPSAEQAVQAFLLRYIILTANNLEEVKVRVRVPDRFGITVKPLRQHVEPIVAPDNSVDMDLGQIRSFTRTVLPFYIRLPEGAFSNQVWKNGHNFSWHG